MLSPDSVITEARMTTPFLGVTTNRIAPNASTPVTNHDFANSGFDGLTVSMLLLQPAIIIIGLTGNGLCLVVFAATHLRLQSTSVYLGYLSLVDSVFLLLMLLVLLPFVGADLINYNGWCQLSVFLSYLSSFLSAWTVACFTTERFVVVFYPLHKKDWCTRRKAFIVLLFWTMVGVALYSFSFWASGIVTVAGEAHCLPLTGSYVSLYFSMSVVDTIMTFIVPFSIIGVLNACTAVKLWLIAYQARRGEIVEENIVDNNAFVDGADSPACCGDGVEKSKLTTSKQERRLSRLELLRSKNSEDDDQVDCKQQLMMITTAAEPDGSQQKQHADTLAAKKKAKREGSADRGTGGENNAKQPFHARLSLTKSTSSSQRNRHSRRMSLYELLTRNRRSIHMRATKTLLLISTGQYNYLNKNIMCKYNSVSNLFDHDFFIGKTCHYKCMICI